MDAEGIAELFAPVGPVQARRMFGGYGIYLDGVIFALQVDGEIMLKGDDQTRAAYDAAGMAQWVYEMKGRAGAMPYWRMPDLCFDDEAELKRLSALALAAGRRHAAAKTKPAPRPGRKARPAGRSQSVKART
ncbi:MAG: TfoX/Sxy family protein [Methylobacteriaceae bacterium]|nr:TfoX/Sxy family protein [Methylobacteriaceae bacterium]